MSQFQDIFPSNYRGKKKRKSRADSDEYYVIDLCDEVLGHKASRQHRFDFLTGDTGKRLPVDAYYEDLNLVVEYYERQHSEPIPYWDKKMTASGVTRQEQRKIYDERRRIILPQHGIKLVVINYFDFGTSKRILRNKAYDIKVVRNLLKEYIPKKQSKAKKKNNTPSTTEINITQALEVVSEPQEKKNVDNKTLLKRKRAYVRDYSIEQRCLILSKYSYDEGSGVIYRTANEEDEYLKGITIYPTSEQLSNEFNLSSCKQLKDSANINDFNADQIAEITCAGYEYDFLSGEIYRTNEDYENEDENSDDSKYEYLFTNQYGYLDSFVYYRNKYVFPTTEQLYKELNLELLESTEPPTPTLTTSEKIWRYLNKKIFVFNYEITLLNSIILLQICTIILLYCILYLNETVGGWLILFISIAITYLSFRNKSFLVFAILTVAVCFTIIFLGLLIKIV
ncbi:MAG: hypothetical protein IKJ98_07350 [Bacteroidales bacterium]|nr:hypothetical protein [Bacteroidales bacterium]